jgi:hypothetical protein
MVKKLQYWHERVGAPSTVGWAYAGLSNVEGDLGVEGVGQMDLVL